jgi:hypothetical protein
MPKLATAARLTRKWPPRPLPWLPERTYKNRLRESIRRDGHLAPEDEGLDASPAAQAGKPLTH